MGDESGVVGVGCYVGYTETPTASLGKAVWERREHISARLCRSRYLQVEHVLLSKVEKRLSECSVIQ